ncbi:hypothetical protein [Streptomyces sioyaensis]|uniref:hypothetical protein n=1 Tax=Streptomyces sioyaensis TaxID=67364 RepID=UPI00379069EE
MSAAALHRESAHDDSRPAGAESSRNLCRLIDAGAVRDVTLGNWTNGHPDDTQHWTPTAD